MAARRTPNFTNLAVEIGFLALAALWGGIGGTLWGVGLLAALQLGYWAWSRKRQLKAMAEKGTGDLAGTTIGVFLLMLTFLALSWGAGAALGGLLR